MPADGSLRIELVADDGTTTVLRESVPVMAGEIVDASVMSAAALREFLTQQIARAKARGRALLAAGQGHDDAGVRPDHLRPRGAGLLPRLFSEYGEALAAVGGDPDEGLGAILQAAQKLPADQRAGVEAAIREVSATARRSPWSIPATGSPACTSPAT